MVNIIMMTTSAGSFGAASEQALGLCTLGNASGAGVVATGTKLTLGYDAERAFRPFAADERSAIAERPAPSRFSPPSRLHLV